MGTAMSEDLMREVDVEQLSEDFLLYAVEYFAILQRNTTDLPNYRAHSQAFSLLYILRQTSGQPMSHYVAVLGIPKQQLTKLVNDLEEKRFVSRRVNPADRRQTLLELTDQGRRFLDLVCRDLLRVIRGKMEEFPKEAWGKISDSVRFLSELCRQDAAREASLSGAGEAPTGTQKR